jgi:hypothetical protein
MKLKLEEQQKLMIEKLGHIVTTPSGSTYMHIPFWFKETDMYGVYEVISTEFLPEELINHVNSEMDNATEDIEVKPVVCPSCGETQDIEHVHEHFDCHKCGEEFN